MAESNVRIHSWMAGVVHASGTSSFRDGCGGCRTSARAGGWLGRGIRRGRGSAGKGGSGRGMASFFAWCKLKSMCLEFLVRSGEVIGGGLERAKGGTFGSGWGVSLELFCDKSKQRAWKARAWVILLGMVVPCAV